MTGLFATASLAFALVSLITLSLVSALLTINESFASLTVFSFVTLFKTSKALAVLAELASSFLSLSDFSKASIAAA